jgi:hypothetical protein
MDDIDRDTVGLDDVDDDRDMDTDAATAQQPLIAPSIDRARAVGALARGAAAGAVGYAGARAVRCHPKATVTAAILGAIIMATPRDQRPQVMRAMGKAAGVLAVLAVLAIGLLVVINANTSPAVTPAPSSVPTGTSMWP